MRSRIQYQSKSDNCSSFPPLRLSPVPHPPTFALDPRAELAGERAQFRGHRATAEPGTYRLTFATGPYLTARTGRAFYPEVQVTFVVLEPRHHHVPLLLSPFGFSTYRGS